MRTIYNTSLTIHVGALENYTKSKNIKKNVNRTLKAREVMERTNVLLSFLLILEHQSQHATFYCFMIKFTQKHTQI